MSITYEKRIPSLEDAFNSLTKRYRMVYHCPEEEFWYEILDLDTIEKKSIWPFGISPYKVVTSTVEDYFEKSDLTEELIKLLTDASNLAEVDITIIE